MVPHLEHRGIITPVGASMIPSVRAGVVTGSAASDSVDGRPDVSRDVGMGLIMSILIMSIGVVMGTAVSDSIDMWALVKDT